MVAVLVGVSVFQGVLKHDGVSPALVYGSHGRRMRGRIVVVWRAGVSIHEALTPTETDLNERRRGLLIRHGGAHDPMGRMFLNILAGLPNFAADRRSLRTREGMAVARATGRQKGKPPRLTPDQRHYRLELLAPAGTRSLTRRTLLGLASDGLLHDPAP
ncbi:MAG TPA: hypothetical protein VFI54_00045 [Solirubrobacteraceae bacterium]|nr:hypothetical protein [Solirubrobacteraceae bacterium]